MTARRATCEYLLMTEATRLLLDGERPDLVARGTILPRGKTTPITVYGLARSSVTLSGRLIRTKEPS